MKVTNVSSPHAVQHPHSNASSQRAKAIEAFKTANTSVEPQSTAQEYAVANPNSVSPEEMSAIKPKQEVDTLAQVEDTQVETTEAKPEAPVKDPALSRQFAQLARQERQLRAKAQAQEQTIKAREQALEAKEQAIKTKETEYSQGYISKDQLKQDTLRILADSGVSYDELTQQILNQQTIDPRLESTINSLKAEIKALKTASEESKQAVTESQQQAYKAAVTQIKLDVNQEVRANPNEYKHISATKSTDDVTELIEETYKKDGRLMSVEEACREVEEYLKDEYVKLKGKLEPAGQPAKVEKLAQQTKQTQPQMKTLTNAAASTRKLSSKERAILAFKGELKQ